MKYSPYYEIINLNRELKEYRKLCRCKSKKYIYYSDWKKQMIKYISAFPSQESLDNFKHYCINVERSAKSIPNLYLNFMILFVTVFVDKFIYNINEVIWMLIVFITLIAVLAADNRYNKEICFYKDIVKIIEEIKKQ